MDGKFSYFASIKGLAMILLFEGLLLLLIAHTEYRGQEGAMILLLSFIGSIYLLILSKEVIYEYKDAAIALGMFFITIFQFILFFAFQYWFLHLVIPNSFLGFALSPMDFLLQSTLVFLLNPTIIPQTDIARTILLINLFGSMIMIMFILQNIWHFKDQKPQ